MYAGVEGVSATRFTERIPLEHLRLDGGSIVARGVDLTRPGESRSTDQFGVEQYPGAR